MKITKLAGLRFTNVLGATIALVLTNPVAAMAARLSVKGRELPCSIEVQTLPGAGGYVPRLKLFNPGPLLSSGTLIRYRLTQGRPSRLNELRLGDDLPADSSTSIVVYPALGFRLCAAIAP